MRAGQGAGWGGVRSCVSVNVRVGLRGQGSGARGQGPGVRGQGWPQGSGAKSIALCTSRPPLPWDCHLRNAGEMDKALDKCNTEECADWKEAVAEYTDAATALQAKVADSIELTWIGLELTWIAHVDCTHIDCTHMDCTHMDCTR